MDTYLNNLLAETSVRYGKPGGIAYHHIADTYIALFTHFIPCGVCQVSSTLLLRRLRSGSKRNAHYTAFREVGRVSRAVQLLRYLSDPAMRRRVTAATNKVEAYNGFSEWPRFGNRGVIADNEQAA